MRAKDRRRYGWAATATSLGAALILVVSAGAAQTAADPSFVSGPAFDAGYGPAGAVVGDFNRDQKPDLAVANCVDYYDSEGEEEIGSKVEILLGDGNGGVRPGTPPPLPNGSVMCSLATADLNGDGAPDLAIVDSTGKDVVILLGDGTGRFVPAGGSPIQAGGVPTSVVAADVNRDGRPDLVVPVADSSGRISGIAILLGDGAGGFAQAPGSPVSILAGNSVSVAVADLDGDGKPDLAVANTGRNEISLLRGNGIGGFGAPVAVGSARRPGKIAVGDVDGNGKPDLASLLEYGAAILLGDGTGNFRPAPGSQLKLDGSDLALVDLNGDGKSDLVTPSGEVGVSVRLATGDGRFRTVEFSPFATDYTLRIAAADFNGDGRPDIAALSGDGLSWPVGPNRSSVLLQTESAPTARPGHARRGDRIFRTRKAITGFAADGTHAAVCTGNHPVAWTPGGSTVTFKKREYSYGCYSDLAVGGSNVAWIETTGCGNTECTDVAFVAKLSGGRSKAVDGQQNDCGAGPCIPTGTWITQLMGGGPLIAWNDWYVDCTAKCNEGQEAFARYGVKHQTLRRYYRGRMTHVREERAAHPLLAVGGGRMAIRVSGKIDVLKPSGARVSAVSAPDVQSVALSHTELGIAGRSALGVYDPATGHLRKSIALGPNAVLQLAGINSRLALLRGSHTLELVRLSDGALISVPLASNVALRLVDAQLTKAGLFYAYNAKKAGGRLVFEPLSKLLARF
jgi:hypothetical protein